MTNDTFKKSHYKEEHGENSSEYHTWEAQLNQTENVLAVAG
jgi:hypothetical protein